MQFVTIERRSGEKIPINPHLVCYLRETGGFTSVAMANGVEHRIALPAAALVEALEKASEGQTVKPLQETPRPDGAPAQTPGPSSGGDPAANIVGEGELALGNAPAAGAGASETDDPGLTDEEQAELAGRAQRAQEKDDDDKGHKGKK